MKSAHEGIKWTCKECRKDFTHLNSLNRHTASVHKGVRYSCNQCDKSFTQKQRLTAHIQLVHVRKSVNNDNIVQEIVKSNWEESESSIKLSDIKEEL